MTREERNSIITSATENAIGTIDLGENFDNYLDYLEEEGVKIDFRYRDLTAEDLAIVDELCFVCDGCGWVYERAEEVNYGLCGNCSEDEEY